MKKQQGFTLIELMIVVAIVAILAAIALPFYADFTFRSKTSEVAAAMDACKTSVQDYREAENTYPNTMSLAGCFTGSTQYMDHLSISGASSTSITIDGYGDANEIDGCQLRLTTSTSGRNWTGTAVANCSGGQVPPRFRN